MSSNTIGIVLLLWVLPIFLTWRMGVVRNRTAWQWGLFLGWIGVAVAGSLQYRPSHAEIEVRELEAELRLAELKRAHQELAAPEQ